MKKQQWILASGQECFEVMEGKLAGRQYQPGKVYSEIPQTEQNRFEKWGPTTAKFEKPKTGRTVAPENKKSSENKK